MKQIFIHLDQCTGCKTCELACAIEHSRSKSLFGAILESPGPRHRLHVENASCKPVPVVCRHCEDAPCLDACISGAIYRDPERGAVLMKSDKCIGCWSCIMMCPFGVIEPRRNGRASAFKCDRCPDRDVPACVTSCPTRALEYMEVENFTIRQRSLVAASAGR